VNNIHFKETNIDNKTSKINGILIGFFISLSMVTKILTSFVTINNNVLFISMFILILSLLNNKLELKKSMLIFIYLILMLFCISLIRLPGNEYTVSYLLGFFFYGIVGIHLVSQEYSLKVVVKTIYIIFLFFLVFLLPSYIKKIKSGEISIDFTMDLSYTILIGIIILVIKTLFYPSGKIFEKIISSLLFTYSMYYLFIINANRGSIMAFCLFLILILVFYTKIKVVKKLMIFSGIIVAVTLTIFFEYFLNQINNLLIVNFNIHSTLMHKLIYQYNSGSFTSNREEMWGNAFELFSNNFLIGAGIGSLEGEYGYYAHNYVLQLLSELGIFMAFPFILLSIYGLYKILKSEHGNEEILLICILFSLSIPRLFISETLWNSSFFWMYIFLMYKIFNRDLNLILYKRRHINR